MPSANRAAPRSAGCCSRRPARRCKPAVAAPTIQHNDEQRLGGRHAGDVWVRLQLEVAWGDERTGGQQLGGRSAAVQPHSHGPEEEHSASDALAPGPALPPLIKRKARDTLWRTHLPPPRCAAPPRCAHRGPAQTAGQSAWLGEPRPTWLFCDCWVRSKGGKRGRLNSWLNCRSRLQPVRVAAAAQRVGGGGLGTSAGELLAGIRPISRSGVPKDLPDHSWAPAAALCGRQGCARGCGAVGGADWQSHASMGGQRVQGLRGWPCSSLHVLRGSVASLASKPTRLGCGLRTPQ